MILCCILTPVFADPVGCEAVECDMASKTGHVVGADGDRYGTQQALLAREPASDVNGNRLLLNSCALENVLEFGCSTTPSIGCQADDGESTDTGIRDSGGLAHVTAVKEEGGGVPELGDAPTNGCQTDDGSRDCDGHSGTCFAFFPARSCRVLLFL